MKKQHIITFISLKNLNRLIFLMKVLGSLTVLFYIGKLTLHASFPTSLAFQFLLGSLYFHMKELQHEALHGPMKWKALNRFLGFILGMPMLVSYSEYQYKHRIHHTYIGTEKDNEYFTYSTKKGLTWPKIISSLFMLEHYRKFLRNMFNVLIYNKSEIIQTDIRKKVKQEYKLFLVIIILILFLTIKYESLIVLKLWVIPLVLFTLPINFLLELPEHVLCKADDTDTFRNTRTIKSNFLMTWFVNGNNYHVEHHYNPNYPISFLCNLHKETKDKIIFLDKSYISFYKSFIKTINNPEKLIEK